MEHQLNAVRSESPILVVTRSSEDLKEIQKIKKQQIRQIFSGLNKAGYLHKLAPYKYDTDTETEYWKIEIAYDQDRMSLIRNLIKAEMGDDIQTTKLLKMETSLNKLYGEMRKYDMTDGVLGFQNIPPGLLVAICDDSIDHVGRFRRGRVIQTIGKDGPGSGSGSGNGRSRSLRMIKCELIDEGEVDIFPSDHLYLLATKFLATPARFFTIQLADLQHFEGSPKFARIFQTMLETYGYQYYMTILKKTEPHPQQQQGLQVILTTSKLSATVTVNDYLLSELFKVDDADMDRLLSPNPVKNSIFSDTILCNVKKEESPGQVRVRIGLCEKSSREMDTIADLLSAAQGNFDSYLEFYKGSREQERLTVGDICVALHPDDGKALRCKILWEPFSGCVMMGGMTERKTFVVDWIDIGIGLETEIPAFQLIPASCINPILGEALPRCKEFQLANIKKVKNSNSNSNSNSKSLLSVLPPGKEVAARVLSVGSISRGRTPGQSSKDPAPLVDLCTYKMGRRGDEVDSLNTKLIKMGLSADDIDIPEFVFSPKKFLEPSGLLHIPMNYPLRNWAPRSYKRSERDHLMVAKGDEIIFFVSDDLISPMDFTIHPWESRWAVQNLECQLQEYFENAPWAAKEGEGSLSSLPAGNFGIYNKGSGVYSRAKIIPNGITNGLETGNMVRLLLLEKGRYEKAACKNVIGIPPSCPLMSTLSPQGAVGSWKDAVDQVAKLKINLNSKQMSKLEIHQNVKSLEKKLGTRLEKEFPNIKSKKAVTASVASVKIDENGRAEFELILKPAKNSSGNDGKETEKKLVNNC